MEARMNHPVAVLPDVMAALQALSKATMIGGGTRTAAGLAQLRASQINGCAVCVDMHTKEMRKAGESDDRLAAVAAWREAPYFTDAERAALALAEAMTRIADSADPVPDAVWDEAAGRFEEKELAALITSIATINVWNRLNVTIRQPVGAWTA